MMFIDVKFRDEFLFLFFSFFICCSFTGMPFVWLENENIRNDLCRHEPRYSRLANWEGIKKVGFLSMAKSSSVLKECVYLIANIIYKLRNFCLSLISTCCLGVLFIWSLPQNLRLVSSYSKRGLWFFLIGFHNCQDWSHLLEQTCILCIDKRLRPLWLA